MIRSCILGMEEADRHSSAKVLAPRFCFPTLTPRPDWFETQVSLLVVSWNCGPTGTLPCTTPLSSSIGLRRKDWYWRNVFWEESLWVMYSRDLLGLCLVTMKASQTMCSFLTESKAASLSSKVKQWAFSRQQCYGWCFSHSKDAEFVWATCPHELGWGCDLCPFPFMTVQFMCVHCLGWGAPPQFCFSPGLPLSIMQHNCPHCIQLLEFG